MSAPPKKMGLSLYASLLEAEKQAQGATISGAPVRYDAKQAEQEAEAKKKKDASLKFQPVKRPQVKSKPKTASSSTHRFSSSVATATTIPNPASSPDKQLPSSTPQQQPSVQKTNFADWVGDEDQEVYFEHPKHERGGKRKKKKTKQETRVWDWDDIYDPTLPNNFADYKGSEEQYREIRDWKARLYYHQLKDAKKNSTAVTSEDDGEGSRPMNRMFAPPSNFSFAPPSFDDAPELPAEDSNVEYCPPPPPSHLRTEDMAFAPPPPAFAPISVPNDATGEDAYACRMRMSSAGVAQSPKPAAPQQPPSAPTPPAHTPVHPDTNKAALDIAAKKAEAQAKMAAVKAKIEAARANAGNEPNVVPKQPPQPAPSGTVPSLTSAYKGPYDANHAPPPPPPPPLAEAQQPGVALSRAPVRYDVSHTSTSISAPSGFGNTMDTFSSAPDAEQRRSNRPGQKGFAERLLKKYGWEKGQGLGASGEGITTAIIAKAEKRKKRSDAEGGGWAQPKNMGKIFGGKRRKIESTADDDGKLGRMSEVVKLKGMLDGLDVESEIRDNNLMQEIGEEFSKHYGNIERLFIWREEMGGENEVFVKFTHQLSALRAVNATDGMTFAGNGVHARFFDLEKFENGGYA